LSARADAKPDSASAERALEIGCRSIIPGAFRQSLVRGIVKVLAASAEAAEATKKAAPALVWGRQVREAVTLISFLFVLLTGTDATGRRRDGAAGIIRITRGLRPIGDSLLHAGLGARHRLTLRSSMS
jgi:hypothetical protein